MDFSPSLSPSAGPGPIEVFFSVSSASRDIKWYDELFKHLSPLLREENIRLRDKRELAAGSRIQQGIHSAIDRADIVILLISHHFTASNECYQEMQRTLKRGETENTRVIFVLLSEVYWENPPFGRHMVLPTNRKPLSQWSQRDAALANVARGIHQVVTNRAESPLSTVSASSVTSPSSFAPSSYRPSPFFTNRDKILKDLHLAFSDHTDTGICTQALNGLRGIGKTQIAMNYAQCYRKDYRDVFWLRITPPELLSVDITFMAKLLHLSIEEHTDESQIIFAIKSWLQQHDHWLLVLDNVEDFAPVNRIVPVFHRGQGHVLIVAHAQIAEAIDYTLLVDQLSHEEGALLLLRRAGIIAKQAVLDAAAPNDRSDALAIARAVDGYPLALDQAGGYIREIEGDIALYHTLYQQQRVKLFGKKGTPMNNGDSQSVITAFSLAFDRVRQENPIAFELLRLLAFLHPDTIPDSLFTDGSSALEEPLRTLTGDPLDFMEAIRLLLRLSLMRRQRKTKTLSMHRLAQEVLVESIPQDEQRTLARQVVRLVNQVFPLVPSGAREICERYFPQAWKCITLVEIFQLTLQEAPSLLQRLGTYCYEQARYREAEEALGPALRLYEQHYQADIEDITQTLTTLGRVYYRQARYQEAEQQHRRALELREQEFGPNHTRTVESLHNLANLYRKQRKYQQAEEYYKRVLAIDQQRGVEDTETAKTVNVLGLNYYEQGDYQQAEEMYQRARSIYEQSAPADHPDLAYTLTSQGVLYEKLGRYLEAEALYRRAFAIRKQALGEKHLDTARSLKKLADIAETLGKDQEAEEHYQQARLIMEQALGADHPAVAGILNNLAFLADKQEEYERAEPLYRSALNIYEQVPGREHERDSARVLHNLGRLYRNMRQWERAEEHLRRALSIREQLFEANHPEIAQSLHNLAELLSEQHADADAAPLFQRALEIRLQKLGHQHPDTLLTQEKCADLKVRIQHNAEDNELHQPPQIPEE